MRDPQVFAGVHADPVFASWFLSRARAFPNGRLVGVGTGSTLNFQSQVGWLFEFSADTPLECFPDPAQ